MKHKDHHLQLSNKCSSVPNGKVSIQGSSDTTMHHLVHASLTSQTFRMWEQFIYNAIHFSWNTRYKTVTLQAVWEHILNIKCTNFLSFIRIHILKNVQNLTPHRTYLNNMERSLPMQIFLDSYLLLNFSGCFSLMIWNLWAIEAS